MIPPITIILANDMIDGAAVMKSCNLNPDSCAVLNESSFIDHVTLYPGEVVYAHSSTSTELLNKFNSMLTPKNSVNLTIVNP